MYSSKWLMRIGKKHLLRKLKLKLLVLGQISVELFHQLEKYRNSRNTLFQWKKTRSYLEIMWKTWSIVLYQPKPAIYNQHQHSRHDKRAKQTPSRNDYIWDKVGKYGNIHSGIPTPDKKYPLFHWKIFIMKSRRTRLILLKPN